MHKSIRNQQLKARGPVLDWRIPLRAMEAHTPRRALREGEDSGPAKVSELRILRYDPTPINAMSDVRADQVPVPAVWTSKNFARYVMQLIRSRVGKSVHRFIYTPPEEHQVMVYSILEKLTLDPATQTFLTPRLLNSIMAYLVKRNQIARARRLYVLAERDPSKLNRRSFHIMLNGAAQADDLANFTYNLRLMLQRNYEADAETWLAFLALRLPKGAKVKVVQLMQEKGLLTTKDVIARCGQYVAEEQLPLWLEGGHDPMLFIECMQEVYGAGSTTWLSNSAVNRMLNILGARGLNEATLKLWDMSRRRDVYLDPVSLNTVLTHCARSRDAELAIHFLALAERDRIRCDFIGYQILFDLARRAHLYNVARVLWRCACVDGITAPKISHWVRYSLSYSGPTTSIGKRWLSSVGKVVVGVLGSGPRGGAEALAALRRPLETGVERARTLQFTTNVIKDDLRAFQTRRRTAQLSDLIRTAFRKDREWIDQGLWDSTSLEWKIENAVTVEFVSREDGRSKVGNAGLKAGEHAVANAEVELVVSNNDNDGGEG